MQIWQHLDTDFTLKNPLYVESELKPITNHHIKYL